MGGVKRISQIAKASTVSARLQPWAQPLEEASKSPRSASTSTDSWRTSLSDKVLPPGEQSVSKVPNQNCEKGNQPLEGRTSEPMAPSSRVTTKSTAKTAKVSSRPPMEQEVLRAVESLYDDELKPYGRILRKRFIEHLEIAGGKADDVDLQHIRVVCESSTRLCTESEAGGEWSAVLCDRQPAFVDVYSQEDPYPEALWSEAAAHFAQFTGEEGLLPGGRYACAQTLVQRGVAFIRGKSLGQVCHWVQLALGHRKILGYMNGAIAPYGQSRSCLKDSAAAHQSSCTRAAGTSGTSEIQVATWDIARDCLRQILASAAVSGRDHVPLSNIKRLFRSRFTLELSETAFGHARLSDLLQTAAFHDICTVQLLDRGYVVSPVADLSNETTWTYGIANDNGKTERSEEPKRLPKTPYSWKVHNTFIHAFASPSSPFGSSCRSSSLPKDMGSARSAWEDSCNALHFRSRVSPPEVKAEEEKEDDDLFIPPSPTLTASPSMSPAPYNAHALQCHEAAKWPCSNGHLVQDHDAVFSCLSACLVGPIRDFPWASSENYGGMGSALAGIPCLDLEAPMVQESHSRVKFCPNEPLCLDEDSFEAAEPSRTCEGLDQNQPTLTPSTLRNSGFVVHNTFISPLPMPPTPIPGAMRRSSSMPCINHARHELEVEVPKP